jgi:transcriptional regulator with XRE-family HTH domain
MAKPKTRKTHSNRETDTIIGGVIRDARVERGVSQAALAEALEWDRCTIVTIEKGTRALSLSEIWMMATGLGLNSGSFMDRVEKAVKRSRRRARVAA